MNISQFCHTDQRYQSPVFTSVLSLNIISILTSDHHTGPCGLLSYFCGVYLIVPSFHTFVPVFLYQVNLACEHIDFISISVPFTTLVCSCCPSKKHPKPKNTSSRTRNEVFCKRTHGTVCHRNPPLPPTKKGYLQTSLCLAFYVFNDLSSTLYLIIEDCLLRKHRQTWASFSLVLLAFFCQRSTAYLTMEGR